MFLLPLLLLLLQLDRCLLLQSPMGDRGPGAGRGPGGESGFLQSWRRLFLLAGRNTAAHQVNIWGIAPFDTDFFTPDFPTIVSFAYNFIAVGSNVLMLVPTEEWLSKCSCSCSCSCSSFCYRPGLNLGESFETRGSRDAMLSTEEWLQVTPLTNSHHYCLHRQS